MLPRGCVELQRWMLQHNSWNYLVKPGNVLLTNCGMSTADRIYPVKTDPHRKPDDRPWPALVTQQYVVETVTGESSPTCHPGYSKRQALENKRHRSICVWVHQMKTLRCCPEDLLDKIWSLNGLVRGDGHGVALLFVCILQSTIS